MRFRDEKELVTVIREATEVQQAVVNLLRRKRFRLSYKCHRTGHMARECPNRKNGSSNMSRRSTAATVEKDTAEAFYLPEKNVDMALRAMEGAEKGRWCLDSGCTSHMCNAEEYFMSKPTKMVGKSLYLASDAVADIKARYGWSFNWKWISG